MAYAKTGDSNRWKDLLKKIGEHGSQEVEYIREDKNASARTMTASRVLNVLEMLYNKAIDDSSLGAAQQYLDRILGKPKESLSIANDNDLIGNLSDQELIERVANILKTAGKGGAEKSGK